MSCHLHTLLRSGELEDEDVGRLEVIVHHLLLVEVRETLGHLERGGGGGGGVTKCRVPKLMVREKDRQTDRPAGQFAAERSVRS